MAGVLIEKAERSATEAESPTRELTYFVHGAADDFEAKTLVAGGSPLTYDGMLRSSIRLTELAPGRHEATVSYADKQTDPTGGYTFQTTGNTLHIVYDITNKPYPVPGKAVIDNKGLIGVHGKDVDGVDIVQPVYNFTETYLFDQAAVTAAYKATLFQLTGTVNKFIFKGFQPGEVLFLGAEGGSDGLDRVKITYHFSCSQNATNLKVGPITGIDKKGWEYLSIRYIDTLDGVGVAIAKKPRMVYVHQVYELKDFAGLGIGT